MADDKLTRAQVELVLRRAAELEKGGPEGDELSTRDVEQLGKEVGLSSGAVRRALGELKSGALTRKPDTLAGVFGPAEFAVERTLKGTRPEAEQAVDRFLHEQLLEVTRHFGDHVVYQPMRDGMARALRKLQLGPRYVLDGVDQIEASFFDEGLRTRVALEVKAHGLRRWAIVQIPLAGLVGALLAALGGILVNAPAGTVQALGLAGGVVGNAGSMALVARQIQSRRERIENGLERFFDFLEQGRYRPQLTWADRITKFLENL